MVRQTTAAVIAEWQERLQNVQCWSRKPGRLGRAQYRPRRRQRQISRVSGYRRQTLSGHVSHAAGDGRERTSRYRHLQRHLCVRKRRESHPIFHWIACPRRMCCRAMSGLSRPGLAEVSARHGLIFIVTTLSASITSISSRPAPSGYPMDHRSPAGRGARAVHQSAVL